MWVCGSVVVGIGVVLGGCVGWRVGGWMEEKVGFVRRLCLVYMNPGGGEGGEEGRVYMTQN